MHTGKLRTDEAKKMAVLYPLMLVTEEQHPS